MKYKLAVDPARRLKVLLVGNGVLRLGESPSWDMLLHSIRDPEYNVGDLSDVPLAMQPECLCGVDVREVQRRTAAGLQESKADASEFLKRLVSLPFDAIVTTNYTYEIERELTGNEWSESVRKNAFVALDGNTHVWHNTCVCNVVKSLDGRVVPVFHIHGERFRKHSLILSYYSYANAVSNLITLNKKRGNIYQEHQETGEYIPCLSWLDYFLLGDVYSVGFGFDTSEFDIWWAIERKARENAEHGKIYAYMIETEDKHKPQHELFHAMDVEEHRIFVTAGFLNAYEKVLQEIKAALEEL